MPGFNKMGPDNKGPMSGGGRGLCSGTVLDDQYGGCGRGCSHKKRRGASGNLFPSGRSFNQQYTTPEFLKSQKEFLTGRLKEIDEELARCLNEQQ